MNDLGTMPLIENITRINLMDPDLDLTWSWCGSDTEPWITLMSCGRPQARGTLTDLIDLTYDMWVALNNV